jgi:hypothetical protein
VAQPPDPPRFLTWLVVAALVFALLLLALFLWVEPLIGLMVAVVLCLMLVAGWRSNPALRHTITLRSIRTASFGSVPEASTERPVVRPLVAAAEITLIVALTLITTGRGYHLDRYIDRLAGTEAEFLTSSAYFASASLREYGYIPKWQPWLESGEPLIHSPFAFIINPFSAGPSLLLGGVQGILVSVVIYAILASVGGWFLGWILGLSSPARLLLALLMLGKGNMQAMISSGFFQLGTSQAYFPWLIAGTLAIFWLPGKRWPVILTALTFALMFLAGNIWYTLPMLVCVALLALYYGLLTKFDMRALRRLALAGVLSVGLSAITLLPIWLERDYIEHPNVPADFNVTPLNQIVPLYFDGDINRRIQIFTRLYDSTQGVETPVLPVAMTYYSYVLPLWFAALIFLVIPPIPYLLHRSGQAGRRGLWVVGGLMIVLCTLWGAGGQPLFVWLYWQIPLLGEWGYPGRALAVASFWIALLAALRVDRLWRALSPKLLLPLILEKAVPLSKAAKLRAGIRLLLVAVVILACATVANDVNQRWGFFPITFPDTNRDNVCVTWLRTYNPGSQLAAWRGGYDAIYTYMDNHVRKFNVEVAYTPLPLSSTIGNLAPLRFTSLPEYGIPWQANERAWLFSQGYMPVPGSQLLNRQYCLWRKADTLPYAYTVPFDYVATLDSHTMLDVRRVSPVTALERRPDEIALIAQSDTESELVLTVQELAYPGWQVELDGQPTALEVLGGQIAVRLPFDGRGHTVYFAFRPSLLYIGAIITLVTCAVCISILLVGHRIRRETH